MARQRPGVRHANGRRVAAAVSERVRRGLGRTATLGERSISEFFADGCPQRAAAVSYYALLSLFPLAIVTVAAFGLVVDDHVARSRVIGFVLDQLPLREGRGRTDLQRTLRHVTAQAGGFGVAGLLGMVLTSSAVMGSIRQALNAAWDAVDTRPFLQAKLVDILLVLGFGALTAASMALDLVAQLATSVVEELDASASAAAAVAAMLLRLGRLVPVLLMLVVFTALFRFAPARSTRLRDIWPGVLVATVGFELARTGFAYYLAVVADYGAVYASLATVVAFLVFVFVAATVLLLGAEVASEWPAVRRGDADADADSEPLGRRIRNAAKGLVVRADDVSDAHGGEPDDSPPRRKRPGRRLAALLRAPSGLYRLGLGRLLGRRFLALTHRGRRTGRLYTTVLEVVRWRPDAGEAVVVSGFGPDANWYRNVIAGGAVEVRIGHTRFGPDVRVLGAAEAAAALADYERRNRLAALVIRAVLGQLTGRPYDGSPAARDRLVRQLPFVAFTPEDRGDCEPHAAGADVRGTRW
jgi:deazaflavin-dependent oxidoreductase (nitroreductase family)